MVVISTKKVSIKKAVNLFRQLNGKCRYYFGAKWSLKATVDELLGRVVDCSGFVRWLIYQTSLIDIGDGSQQQNEKVEKLGWRKLNSYKDLQYAQDDENRMFIAFLKPVFIGGVMVKAGHVWLVWRGGTIESCGGKGVSRRKWDSAVFLLRGAVAYEIPCAENVQVAAK